MHFWGKIALKIFCIGGFTVLSCQVNIHDDLSEFYITDRPTQAKKFH